MNILSIDTALRTCGIGVMRDGDVVFKHAQPMPRGQNQALAIAVETALEKTGVAMSDLSAIAVTVGPGSFTGIRIGMAFARGLVSVLKIPLIGLTTLEVLSHQTAGHVAVIIEIKKDAYIAQVFDDGVAQTEISAVNQEELTELLNRNQVKTVVTHSEPVKEFLTMECHLSMPDPSVMLKMAKQKYQQEGAVHDVVRPLYIRSADVTVKAEKN